MEDIQEYIAKQGQEVFSRVANMGWKGVGKAALRQGAVTFGVPAAIGFTASGGNLRGATSGAYHGAKGGAAGALGGGLLFGALGTGLGLAAVYSSPGFRREMLGTLDDLVEKYVQPRLSTKNMGFLEEVLEDVSSAFLYEKSPPLAAAFGGFVGGTAGAVVGSTYGSIRGAWAAGRNVKANQAYNRIGGIGL